MLHHGENKYNGHSCPTMELMNNHDVIAAKARILIYFVEVLPLR